MRDYTKLGLSWVNSQELKGATFLDYGCGNGILGKTAKRNGASKVYCLDSDVVYSCAFDPFDTSIEFVEDPGEVLTSIDFIIVTLSWYIIADLYPIIKELSYQNTKIALSGINKEKTELVLETYKEFRVTTSLGAFCLLEN